MNEIKINKNNIEVKVAKRNGYVYNCLFSLEDLDYILNNKFSIRKCGTHYYIQDGRNNLAHRIITNATTNMLVDHINRNTLDNRRCNLRICTSSENNKNRAGYGRCNYKYMSINKERKGHKMSYSVNFPNVKKRAFTKVNEAKAYYLECLFNLDCEVN